MTRSIKMAVPIISIFLFTPTLLMGQDVNNLSEATQAFNAIKILTQNQNDQSAVNVPVYVFTLPKPKYKLPNNIQNIIMFLVKINPSKEAVLRDEYKAVYKSKKDMIKWHDENVNSAWAYVYGQSINLVEYYANNGDSKNLAITFSMVGNNGNNLTSQADRWISYVNSNW